MALIFMINKKETVIVSFLFEKDSHLYETLKALAY